MRGEVRRGCERRRRGEGEQREGPIGEEKRGHDRRTLCLLQELRELK